MIQEFSLSGLGILKTDISASIAATKGYGSLLKPLKESEIKAFKTRDLVNEYKVYYSKIDSQRTHLYRRTRPKFVQGHRNKTYEQVL